MIHKYIKILKTTIKFNLKSLYSNMFFIIATELPVL